MKYDEECGILCFDDLTERELQALKIMAGRNFEKFQVVKYHKWGFLTRYRIGCVHGDVEMV